MCQGRRRVPVGDGGDGGVALGVLVTAGYALRQHWPVVVPWPASRGRRDAGPGAVAGRYPAVRAARLAIRLVMAEIVTERLLKRRRRSFPRVVKRKMSNYRLKRAHHRAWAQLTRLPTRPWSSNPNPQTDRHCR